MTFHQQIRILYCLLLINISCKTTERVAYFQDIKDSSTTKVADLNVAAYHDPIIRAGDILHISIQTVDSPLSPLSGKLPSPASYASGQYASSSGQILSGFLVDKNGMIEMPVLGRLSAAGLSTALLHDSLKLRAAHYFKGPVIEVRFANFTVTVLGEVGKPGSYVFSNEKVSILDAIGAAGDMTIYGRKDNILVIRDASEKKEAARLNLNTSTSLTSSYFFLRQGDVVMVEPNKVRIAAATEVAKTRKYAIIASGLSVLIILISRLTL